MADMRHILLLGLVLGWLVTGTAGQEQTDSYPEDAERLYVLARDLWSPVELESQRWVKLKLDNTEIRRRLRQGCVLLEAAVALDRNNAMAWRDQVSLLASEAVGDPGRSLDALVQYSQLKPSDYAPVDDWLRFRLSRFNERKEREAFLQQSLVQLVNYPVMQSKIWTEMAILSLEKGDDATARQQFARAFHHPQSGQSVSLWWALNNYAWHGRHHTAQVPWLREQNCWRGFSDPISQARSEDQ